MKDDERDLRRCVFAGGNVATQLPKIGANRLRYLVQKIIREKPTIGTLTALGKAGISTSGTIAERSIEVESAELRPESASEDSEPEPAVSCHCGEPGRPEHTCPYKQDINSDSETVCNCCQACENECAKDI